MPYNFDVDFSILAKNLNDARLQSNRERALSDLGQGGTGPADYNTLGRKLLATDPEFGLSLLRLGQQQYMSSPEHAGAIAEAQAKVSEKYAPKTSDITLPGGEKVTVQKGARGYELPTVRGLPETDPNVANVAKPPPGADVKEWRKLATEDLFKAQQALPNIEAQTTQALKVIDDIRSDPYKKWATGLTSPLSKIPGTPLFDFAQKVEQIKGKSFLEAYQTLKGGGAITEIEGTKATNAIARLNTAQTEKGFDAALNDLEDVIKTGAERARQKAQANKTAQPQQSTQPARSGLNQEAIKTARDNPQAAIAEAKAAIASGKDPNMVKKRLQLILGAGYETGL